MNTDRRLARTPRSELERRWQLVRARLDATDCEALVTIGTHNTWNGGMNRWLTDFMVTYRRVSVFHQGDDMTLVEHGPVDGHFTPGGDHPNYPGVGEVFTVSAFPAVSFTGEYEARIVTDVLRRRAYRRVALYNPGSMPYGFLQAIRNALGDSIEFIDDTDFFDEVKAIKSEEEMAMLRRAAQLQDEVFQKVVASVRPGMYDFEVCAIAEHAVRMRRGRFGVYLGSSAPPGEPAHLVMNEEQGRRIERGDVYTLLIENGSPEGMFVELMRTISFGEPASELVHACQQASAAQAHTYSMLKPGAACSDIFARYSRYMEDNGLAPDRRLYSHGQGVDLVERPLIRQDETMVIRTGMNMAVHPCVATSTIFAPVCDNVLVHENGVEPLHRTEKRIFEAGL